MTPARIDLRPVGQFSSVMHGPNGKAFENVGVFLEVESVKRLVTTDVVRPGWIPNGRASMSAEVFFEPTGEMRTRYAACAWHWDQAAQNEHEAMEGWGEGADQLEALAGPSIFRGLYGSAGAGKSALRASEGLLAGLSGRPKARNRGIGRSDGRPGPRDRRPGRRGGGLRRALARAPGARARGNGLTSSLSPR